jgi:hypothetical protein
VHLEGTELSCRSLGVTVSGNALEWTATRPPWIVIVLHQTNRAKNRRPHARALPSCAPPRGLVTATGDLPRTTARPSSTHLLLHMRPCGSVGTPTLFLPSSPRLAGAHARPHMVVARTSWGSRATTRDRGAHAHGALPRHRRGLAPSTPPPELSYHPSSMVTACRAPPATAVARSIYPAPFLLHSCNSGSLFSSTPPAPLLLHAARARLWLLRVHPKLDSPGAGTHALPCRTRLEPLRPGGARVDNRSWSMGRVRDVLGGIDERCGREETMNEKRMTP